VQLVGLAETVSAARPRTAGRSLEEVNATKTYDDTLVAELPTP
jgi:hypothetical protein